MLARLILWSLACTIAGGYLYKVNHALAWVPIVTAVVLLMAVVVAVIKAVRSHHECSASELALEEEQLMKRARS